MKESDDSIIEHWCGEIFEQLGFVGLVWTQSRLVVLPTSMSSCRVEATVNEI